MKKPKLIVITGPTASGKSALAVSLAKVLKTEIISGDSRQIYKGIPIVTAVPTEEEKEGITHHLLEMLPLDAYYSAARFVDDANEILKHLFSEKETAIVCGGSMMYIDALVDGIDELPTVPADIRNELTKKWQLLGNEWLLSQLLIVDPVYYQKVDHKNLKRVFHAIEVTQTAGKPYSSLITKNISLPSQKKEKERTYEIFKICISGERDLLFNRINRRVLTMVEMGLEEEARRVFPYRHLNSLNTVGLKEMFAYFDGLLSRDEAILRIQKNTRVYAKKQMTWHKRDGNLKYLDLSDTIEENTNKILKYLGQKS